MDPAPETHFRPKRNLGRLKLLAGVLTVLGVVLFTYLVYSIGVHEILDGVAKFGFDGFAVIVALFFTRVVARGWAWKLSVHAPYSLRLRDTVPAVIMGEAMSITVPLGILASGTTKAIAVRRRIPLVGGLSSVATENLFYSFTTGLFLIIGAVVFVRAFAVDESVIVTIDVLIATLAFLIVLGLTMVIRQWHFLSETCEWIYARGYLRVLLEDTRVNIRKFEDLIYGFYRHYPGRFVPICGIETLYHLLGIAEVWFVLYRLGGGTSLLNAFLLESVSRLITIIFKLVPFMVGVDEAGAQFVGQTVALAAGIGITLAIIRKGRILFWAAVGWALIIKRGISFELEHEPETLET